MNKFKPRDFLIGSFAGFIFGFIVLHPFSMLFQEMIHPVFNLDFAILNDAFNPHHLPMAIFFGLLGSITGALIAFLLSVLSREKEKVKMLEGLLPVCAWCKKIRDDDGKADGTGDWVEIEHYIRQRSEADFTHGICQECCEKFMKDQNNN